MRNAVLAIALVACGDSTSEPEVPREQVALVPVAAKRDVDLLFVIDDSTNFLGSQIGLKNAFPALLDELSQSGELPNLHVGVVTSDLGTHGALDSEPGPAIGNGPGACWGTGKTGRLTSYAPLVSGNFISDVGNGDGTRTTNYTSSLAEAFSALASVGSSGCGFEQHLEAAKRALDNNPANAGFLRDAAALAIIVFTDEDDCSFAHSSFLDPNDSSLGPLASFRCTQFGVRCETGGRTPDEMASNGIKEGCVSNEQSAQLLPLSSFVSFFKGLKSDPRDVLVSTIAGDSNPFEVTFTSIGGSTPLHVVHNVCMGLDPINPSVRLAQLPAMFERGRFESICTTDLAPAVTSIARELRGMLGDACLTREIAIPADCKVFDQTPTRETELPPCSAQRTTDCYQLVEDASCTTSHHLRVDVTRSSAPATDVMIAARCRL